MQKGKEKIYYLAGPDDPVNLEWRETFNFLAAHGQQELSISVSPLQLQKADTTIVLELLYALQHYPGFIDRLVFSISFEFLVRQGINLKREEADWKMQPLVYRWFANMKNCPMFIFFIRDHDARFYFLAGDMIFNNEIKTRQEPGEERLIFHPTEAQFAQLSYRLFSSCWGFLLYCRGSGLDPQRYIEALIAEYDMTFSYEDVLEKYEQQVKRLEAE